MAIVDPPPRPGSDEIPCIFPASRGIWPRSQRRVRSRLPPPAASLRTIGSAAARMGISRSPARWVDRLCAFPFQLCLTTGRSRGAPRLFRRHELLSLSRRADRALRRSLRSRGLLSFSSIFRPSASNTFSRAATAQNRNPETKRHLDRFSAG